MCLIGLLAECFLYDNFVTSYNRWTLNSAAVGSRIHPVRNILDDAQSRASPSV